MRRCGPTANNGPGRRFTSVSSGGFPRRSAQRRLVHQHAGRQGARGASAVQARPLRDHIQEVTRHCCVTS